MSEVQSVNLNEVGGKKMEQQYSGNKQESRGGVDELIKTRLGIAPTGAMYTITDRDLKRYFQAYFQRAGYDRVEFAVTRKSNSEIMAVFAFPKSGPFLGGGKGRQSGKALNELMGGPSHGSKIFLDGKFKELVQPFFIDQKHAPYVTVLNKDKANIAYVEISFDAVIAWMFNASKTYAISLANSEFSKHGSVFQIIRRQKALETEPSKIEDIIFNNRR